MSDLSRYQHVFRVSKPDSTVDNARSRLTNNARQAVSCTTCKTRKLKCDRRNPCSSCVRQKEISSCKYAVPHRGNPAAACAPVRATEVQIRLQKLEDMVKELLQASSHETSRQSVPRSSQRTQQDSMHNDIARCAISDKLCQSPGGRLDTRGSEVNYVGATHWATILENIYEIQDVLDPGADHLNTQEPIALLDEGPDIVLGGISFLSMIDVCRALPPKATIDKLLSLYFSTRHTSPPVLHSKKFLREYEAFHVDPLSTSFLWVSMLFSALFIASRIEQNATTDEDSSCNSIQRNYLGIAGQALVAGEYQRARTYSVESLLMYGLCKYIQTYDSNGDAWLIMGSSARLAMRMGYHRDSRRFLNVSAFEGEMRRRTFAILTTFELMLSIQAGLPSIMNEDDYDTQLPGNLHDADFDEDCKVLPAPRPSTDPTPMLYYCFKTRMAKIIRRIVPHATNFSRPAYEDTMKLDRELRSAYGDAPASLRITPPGRSFVDQEFTYYNRVYVYLLYLKGLCLLHRHYLDHDRSDPRFEYSRQAAAEAAMLTLEQQATMYNACAPGGPFHGNKTMLSSLTLHDFLLGAMVMCLDVYEFHRTSATKSVEGASSQAEKYDALELSYQIWKSRASFSTEARRAANILAVMLDKVQRPASAWQHDITTNDQPLSGAGERFLASWTGRGMTATLDGTGSSEDRNEEDLARTSQSLDLNPAWDPFFSGSEALVLGFVQRDFF